MKKILISIFVIGVVGAVTVGATRAYFSASKTLSGNTLATGTVTLGKTYNFQFSIENLAPGETETQDLAVKYNGSLDADLYIGAQHQYGYDLGPILEYRLQKMDSNWQGDGWINNKWKNFNDTYHLMNRWLKTHEKLEKGDWARARLHIRIKTPADNPTFPNGLSWNDYQGRTEGMRIHLYAVQEGTGHVPTTEPRDY